MPSDENPLLVRGRYPSGVPCWIDLVVDDVDAARAAVRREGLEVLGHRPESFDFRDPWGNRFQVVGYANVQFERTPGVRRALGIEELAKTERARAEIADRGLTD
jgi:hypothetical protein